LKGYDAIEVYNLYTNSKSINYATLFFDGLWSYRSYPELLFARFYERPADALKRWDEVNASGASRAYALAGNDAHANVGFSLGGQTGERLLDFKLDPYERSFRVVRNHVLLEKGSTLDEASLLAALRAGRRLLRLRPLRRLHRLPLHGRERHGHARHGRRDTLCLRAGAVKLTRARPSVAARSSSATVRSSAR
jgi:hypothetical protein